MKDIDYEVWLNKAVMQIGKLDIETIFVLKDLFQGIEWNILKKGERLNLGRKFKANVDTKKIPNVIVVDSPKGKSTTYKKAK